MNTNNQTNFVYNSAVELLSAGTTVTAYHPFRTIATQLVEGVPVRWCVRSLYRGFFASALASHQLFGMGAIERVLRNWYSESYGEPSLFMRVLLGAMAGVFTTPTVTPLEMITVQRQLDRSWQVLNTLSFFRGFIPTAFRQAGLGAGMFILPGMIKERMELLFPLSSLHQDKVYTFGASFLGGCITATMTQFFEGTRLIMQTDTNQVLYKSTWKAFQAAHKLVFSRRGGLMFASRLTVVAVATVVMNFSKDFYSKFFGKGFS